MWPKKEAVDPNGKERKEYEWTYPVARVNTHPALSPGKRNFAWRARQTSEQGRDGILKRGYDANQC
jgi:hypothetical protein